MNSSVGVSGHDAATGARLWHIEEANRFPIPMPVVPRRHHLHEPRLPQQSVHGDSARRQGRRRREPRRLEGAVGRARTSRRSSTTTGLIYMVGDVGVLTVIDAGDRRARVPGADRRRLQRLAGGRRRQGLSRQRGRRDDRRRRRAARRRSSRAIGLNARQLASPAVAGGRLFIRSDDALYAIGK